MFHSKAKIYELEYKLEYKLKTGRS